MGLPMAIFHPPSPPSRSNPAELKVRSAFSALDDQWHVCHQIWWQGPRRGLQADGQADFVLIHPAHGLIVLEVKSGELGLASGSWFTIGRDRVKRNIDDPF